MTARRPLLVATALVLAFAVAGCSTVSRLNPFGGGGGGGGRNKVTASPGERISVIAFDQRVAVSDALKGASFALPEPRDQADWPTPSGPIDQPVENVAAASSFEVAWKRGVGQGSSRRVHVTAPIVASGGRIFAMDARASVSAVDAASGAVVWRTDLNPDDRRDGEAFGGGVAVSGDRLFVTSGYRLVAALDLATGRVIWTQRTSAPIHAAPIVAAGRVMAVAVDDQMISFDAATGAPAWTYEGLTEPARILMASSPAVAGDAVYATFASGEVVALRAANGTPLWQQVLSRSSRTNALSEIRDIPGRPVLYKGDLLAGSHSGVFAALDQRSGQPRWTIPVVSWTTPWAAGDVVFITSKAGEVICANRENGQIYWIRDLNEGRKRKERATWSGPLLASNRLIVVSTKGEATALDPQTGAVSKTLRLGAPAVISPIAVGGRVFVMTQDAELVAIG